ncbi:MAG: hypothetical protein K0S32_713 [Bacteroidetes bacterium]|jgi:uncharacterized membrane protein YcaP (DUF421 family)|nr:hypothetical protein [Bacteroidota bacterium]
MNTVKYIFGEGEQLSVLQMSSRAVVIFCIGLILLRLSGRRAFGMRMPFDNVMAILLGAILSRAVTGASPFWPVVAASGIIAFLHRFFGWWGMKSRFFGKLIKGEAKVIYENGKLVRENMSYCRISENDLIEGIRSNSGLDSFEKIKTIYIERDGHISIIKKEEYETPAK